MKSASNMIAKWYQYAIRPLMPGKFAKICAMPTASDTAPPVRADDVLADLACSVRQVDGRHAEASRTPPAEVLMAK